MSVFAIMLYTYSVWKKKTNIYKKIEEKDKKQLFKLIANVFGKLYMPKLK